MASRVVAVCAIAMIARTAIADDDDDNTPDITDGGGADDEVIVVEGDAPSPYAGRATSRVTRAELDERLPRSTPDALRWEPGVYVQQTAAAQGSPFLRGRTGQQTVLLFDGVRLNNSLWRQGPNQYFFSVDARTLAGIDVVRGGASTRFGSDAIGGVLDAIPRDPDPGPRGVAPRATMRWSSADHELGGRVEVATAMPERGALLVGFGARDVSLLESGGPVAGPGGAVALVPRFAADGRTQLGTGFRELAWDARWVQPAGAHRVTVGYYDDRITDAPRTDQCPPAFAPADECLVFDEQFHALLYAAIDLRGGRAIERARITLSAQEQHERELRDRPSSFVVNGGRDDVRTLGVAGQAVTRDAAIGSATARLGWGGDAYADAVDSVAWLTFTDVGQTIYQSRGQYLAGSRYVTAGVFGEPELRIGRITARAGGRAGIVTADAPADAASATTAIDRAWWTTAGYVGAEVALGGGIDVRATVDRSFRAPNLDDLTGRQATGPGFQFENAALAPETAWTAEVGARLRRGSFSGDAWIFGSRVGGAIARSLRDAADCPPDTPECSGAWFRYQLVNLDDPARIVGAEAQIAARAGAFGGRATVSAARGDDADGVPLSRIPPLNGTLEVTARRGDAWIGAGLRWAAAQTRLAPADRGDPRIPDGGTPGHAVIELRGGVRLATHARIAVVLDNLGDAAYRYHGSSVNGPGRSVTFHLEVTP